MKEAAGPRGLRIPNCNSAAAASRPPLRSPAHLATAALTEKKGLPSAPDENPQFYTANWLHTVTTTPLPDVTYLQCAQPEPPIVKYQTRPVTNGPLVWD